MKAINEQMNPSTGYTRQVGFLTIVSGLLALLCLVLSGIALADHPDAFADPVQVLSIPNVSSSLLRWSMLADLMGYYLLLLPVIFWLHQWLKAQTPWAPLITFCATSYVLIGAIGAIILAVLTPTFLAEYTAASADGKATVQLIYKAVVEIVYGALWNTLEVLLAGAWLLFTGFFLTQFGRTFRWATLLLGMFSILDGLGEVLGLKTIAEVGLNGYLILAPIWAIWLGVVLWLSSRHSVSMTHRTELAI
ncbi:hypothetical protein [Salmonirosea aquatica]|uniref:DUF4386 family protein n=1 Tax=Salmonirosea aquatica TaxID=2654236 RepID=A0A7C9BJP1_9BACT|nr:hypothetical protein [Cytophagaceae bacterium SJW1-29]